ncbi:MAG TPA: flagellar protein [Peptococcaceae bacterium]|nr:flagellar protein [Peptococcaceae bacterium]
MVDKIYFPESILPQQKGQAKRPQEPGSSFEDVLAKRVKFSGHAQDMVSRRQIDLSPGHIQRINDAVNKAEEKGARDSLVLIDGIALVVSVKNRTVITAVDQPHMKGKVFTNIDSAVIA